MAIDVERLKQVRGYWFPKEDTECSAVVFDELPKLKQLPLKGNALAVQAGGNCGVFPVAMADIFDRVVTFEPDEVNYECLVKNIDANPKILHFHAGLSDRPGQGGMVGEHGEAYNLVNCGALQMVENAGDIPLMTVDSLGLDACDLIYLDVEGFEDLALLGAEETIQKFKPVIVCENKGLIPNFPSDRDGSEEFREFVCTRFGYEVYGRLMRDDIFTCK